jgi:hypothetical protein
VSWGSARKRDEPGFEGGEVESGAEPGRALVPEGAVPEQFLDVANTQSKPTQRRMAPRPVTRRAAKPGSKLLVWRA